MRKKFKIAEIKRIRKLYLEFLSADEDSKMEERLLDKIMTEVKEGEFNIYSVNNYSHWEVSRNWYIKELIKDKSHDFDATILLLTLYEGLDRKIAKLLYRYFDDEQLHEVIDNALHMRVKYKKGMLVERLVTPKMGISLPQAFGVLKIKEDYADYKPIRLTMKFQNTAIPVYKKVDSVKFYSKDSRHKNYANFNYAWKALDSNCMLMPLIIINERYRLFDNNIIYKLWRVI